MNNIKLVATDLDGTFLKEDRSISANNLKALHLLGDKDMIRVAATGRNLHKVEEVIRGDVPFDYIVFSSGAGVFDWKRRKHIFNRNIDSKSSKKISNYFIERRLNFHAFFPVPQNHKHWYFRGDKKCEEFERYFEFNNAYATDITKSGIPETEMCQFLVIIPENRKSLSSLKRRLSR